MALHRREDVLLDAADQDRVRRLLGDEPLQVAVPGCPLGLDDLRSGVRRGADVADLALADEVGEGAEGLLHVGVGAGPVDLVEVDVVGAQAAQGVLDLAHDPAAGSAALVRVLAHRHEELRGEEHVVAAALAAPPDDLLGHAAGVDVGGVDEVDAGVEGAVDDAGGVVAVVVAPGAEHHRAEAQGTDRYAGAAEGAVFHAGSSLES